MCKRDFGGCGCSSVMVGGLPIMHEALGVVFTITISKQDLASASFCPSPWQG